MATHRYGRFVAAHGEPVSVPPAIALGAAGIRDEVHPRDVSALRLPSRAALERFDGLTHSTVPLLAVADFAGPDAPEGVVAIYDLRPTLGRSTDPALPDD